MGVYEVKLGILSDMITESSGFRLKAFWGLNEGSVFRVDMRCDLQLPTTWQLDFGEPSRSLASNLVVRPILDWVFYLFHQAV